MGVANIRQPEPSGLELGFRPDIVSELDVLSAVQSEPALLERVLDRERVGRYVLEHVLQLLAGRGGAAQRAGGCGRGASEGAGEHPREEAWDRGRHRGGGGCGGFFSCPPR